MYAATDSQYLYLRMENASAAGWPSTGTQGEARYKWVIDTVGGDIALSGGSIVNGEFVLMVEDLTNNEVAETLGISKAAASKRYVQALRRLRKVLSNIPGFVNDMQP